MFETRELTVVTMYFTDSEVIFWTSTFELVINLSPLSLSFGTYNHPSTFGQANAELQTAPKYPGKISDLH